MDLTDYKTKKSDPTGNQIYICCPFCVERGEPTPDERYRMGVHLKKGVYHCHRCRAKGKISQFEELSMLADPEPAAQEKSLSQRIAEKFEGSNSWLQPIDLDSISWPLTKDCFFAYNYIKNRGYSDDEISYYNLRVGKTGYDENGEPIRSWKGRILFPFFLENRCIYLVGRSYNGKEPKYYNTIGPKGFVVYGIDDCFSDTAILCEGVISSHNARRVTGYPSLAILGKEPLQTQIYRIQSKVKKVYVALDGDVDTDTKLKLFKRLKSAGLTVYDIPLPDGQDPDSLGSHFGYYFSESKKISLL